MRRINWSRPLTLEERKQIEQLIKQGLSCGNIAQEINRSKNCVVVEVRRNGKELYNAKLAHKDAIERDQKKRRVVSLKLKEAPPSYQMKQRIENLEMQVEILHDTIKEILKR